MYYKIKPELGAIFFVLSLFDGPVCYTCNGSHIEMGKICVVCE